MSSLIQIRETQWHPATPCFTGRAPDKLRPWLIDRDSLTRQLTAHCPDKFRVKVLRQYWQPPLQSEAVLLGLASRQVTFIREVHLYCDQQQWVFARTVIPLKTLRGELQKLTQLGTQPLGAVLFANHSIERGPIEIARFRKNNIMYNDAIQNTADNKEIWGRRSLFYLKSRPLLVNELFLGKIPPKLK